MRWICVITVVLTLLSFTTVAWAGDLAALFPAEEMRDVKSLRLVVAEPKPYTPSTPCERTLTRIDVMFTSFEWEGETWRHRAVVLLPSDRPEAYRGCGVIVSAESAKSEGTLRLAETAAAMGLPVLLIGSGNPGARYGVRDEGDVMGMGSQRFIKAGDPRWLGYPWLGKVIVRAVTAAEQVPGFDAERFVVTGCSKRGAAAWIAAAVDDRIVGAMPTCWGSGNVEAFLEHKAQRWGLDYQPRPDAKTIAPAFVSTRQQIASFKNSAVRESLKYVDPYLFKDRFIDKTIVYVFGSDDPLFPPTSSWGFLPQMPATVYQVIAANEGHTPNTWRHRRAWQMLLAHCFGGRPMPRLELRVEPRGEEVEVVARIEQAGEIESVNCWHTSDAEGAYHDAKWEPLELRPVEQNADAIPDAPVAPRVYRATITLPADQITAMYAEVLDHDSEGVPGIGTSMIEEWPAYTPTTQPTDADGDLP
ncbi:MAG: hypothetical protein IT442_16265 [Phycisphaeraceae bacterium]|nr:hypothetical protein [Phycisphaeraceae bacterium]